jgi:hypothetical protein
MEVGLLAMNLLPSSYISLAPDLTNCRLPVGMWQVSGAHGPIDPSAAIAAMFKLFDAGFTTFDLAPRVCDYPWVVGLLVGVGIEVSRRSFYRFLT